GRVARGERVDHQRADDDVAAGRVQRQKAVHYQGGAGKGDALIGVDLVDQRTVAVLAQGGGRVATDAAGERHLLAGGHENFGVVLDDHVAGHDGRRGAGGDGDRASGRGRRAVAVEEQRLVQRSVEDEIERAAVQDPRPRVAEAKASTDRDD